MNIANKLTVLRIILAPTVAAGLLLCDRLGWICWLVTGLLFAVAAISDALDGKIARSRGLITDFGKLMDPVADKLLVSSVFICFAATGICSAWVPIIVLFRELLVTSMRMVAASRGEVLAANIWGKLKTVAQMLTIALVMLVGMLKALGIELFSHISTQMELCCQILLWFSAAITLISGAVIVWQNKQLFAER